MPGLGEAFVFGEAFGSHLVVVLGEVLMFRKEALQGRQALPGLREARVLFLGSAHVTISLREARVLSFWERSLREHLSLGTSPSGACGLGSRQA